MGVFSHKFSIAPSGETTDRIKKGLQKWYGPILYHHAKYGGDRRSRASRGRKSVMIFCLFFVTLWNDDVCDNGNAMKQCNFQNNYGVIA